MRVLLSACLLLTLAVPAMAEDRYGPRNPAAASAAAASYAPVALLSWAGKVEATAPQARVEDPVLPLVDGVLRRTSAYDGAPAPTVVATAAPPPAENAPWRRLTGVAAAPRPTAAPAAMEDADAPPQARPTQPVAAASPLPMAQAANVAPRSAAGEQARYYSLHREYGETPVPIPAPEKNQVFLAGGPLASGVGDGAEPSDSEGTGRTAAINKARLAADWASSGGK